MQCVLLCGPWSRLSLRSAGSQSGTSRRHRELHSESWCRQLGQEVRGGDQVGRGFTLSIDKLPPQLSLEIAVCRLPTTSLQECPEKPSVPVPEALGPWRQGRPETPGAERGASRWGR